MPAFHMLMAFGDNADMYKQRGAGETLDLLMQKHGIKSEAALEKAIEERTDSKLTQPTIHRTKAGDTEPSPKTLRILAQFFGVSLNQMSGLEPIPGVDAGEPEKAQIGEAKGAYTAPREARLLALFKRFSDDQQEAMLAFFESIAAKIININEQIPKLKDPDSNTKSDGSRGKRKRTHGEHV